MIQPNGSAANGVVGLKVTWKSVNWLHLLEFISQMKRLMNSFGKL